MVIWYAQLCVTFSDSFGMRNFTIHYVSRWFWHAKFCSTFPDGFQITQNAVILELCKVCNFIELPLSFGCWGFEAWFWGLEVWGWEFVACGWGFKAWCWGFVACGWGSEAWRWVFEAWGWRLEVLGWGFEACGWGFEAAGDYHKINICSYYQWNDVELSAFAALVLVADVHGLLHSRGRFRFGFVKHFDKSVGVKGKKEVKEEKIIHPIFFSSFFYWMTRGSRNYITPWKKVLFNLQENSEISNAWIFNFPRIKKKKL